MTFVRIARGNEDEHRNQLLNFGDRHAQFSFQLRQPSLHIHLGNRRPAQKPARIHDQRGQGLLRHESQIDGAAGQSPDEFFDGCPATAASSAGASVFGGRRDDCSPALVSFDGTSSVELAPPHPAMHKSRNPVQMLRSQYSHGGDPPKWVVRWRKLSHKTPGRMEMTKVK